MPTWVAPAMPASSPLSASARAPTTRVLMPLASAASWLSPLIRTRKPNEERHSITASTGASRIAMTNMKFSWVPPASDGKWADAG